MADTGRQVSSKDDYILAAISHATFFFFPILAPLIVWLLYKDKSPYVRFQALQALAYQAATFLCFMVMWVMAFILSFILIGFLLIPIVLLFWLAAAIYGLYGAYKTFNAKDFKYILIGDFVGKRL